MDPTSLVTLSLLAAVIVMLVWLVLILKRQTSIDPAENVDRVLQSLKSELIGKQMEGLLSLRESLDSANRLLNERLAESTNTLDRRLELFGEIERKLGELEVETKNIREIGSNIQSLSDLLKPPRLRGALGELLLENLLIQILPRAMFSTQYRFQGGQRVDAVIKLGRRLLPIDSKFPLESFRQVLSEDSDNSSRVQFGRTLKQHIDAVAEKYVRPELGTTDFAVMYIPSEAVYTEFVSQKDTDALEYALTRKVIPSSPGHLYAFLASLSALYLECGLAADSGRLAAGLNMLTESLTRLSGLHQRMEGSVRSLSASLSKSIEVSQGMSQQMTRLRHAEGDKDTVDAGTGREPG